MRKLMMVLACVLVTSNAFAFSDAATVNAVKDLIGRTRSQNLQEKSASLEQMKKFMFNRLNTIEMPEDATDAQIEEYRSLTEFDTYLNMINVSKLNSTSCAANAAHIKASTGATEEDIAAGRIGSEAQVAEAIIAAFCQ